QVALHLSCKADVSLSPVLCGNDVMGPMIEMVDLACRRAAAGEVKDAWILHGGLCAAGFLSKVLVARLRSNDVQLAEVLNSDLLIKLVTLVGHSADAVLVAVNVMEPCYTEPITPEGLGSGLPSTGQRHVFHDDGSIQPKVYRYPNLPGPSTVHPRTCAAAVATL
ncbi:hypothetical protein VaNZ11_006299, partial [Volvox africanus]